ncbi:HlyD family secretion protein [Bryobacter aggregatus]|uniref:HlyD family secretion protein n=1 Tax=Bryobacter aggregatus TaxID=360054 RepID=UPI00068C35E4|nr:HlyD family secretion protein [Bryobacter aggregatus]
MEKKTLIVSGVLLVAAVTAGAVYLNGQGKEKTDDAQIDGRLVNIAPKISGYLTDVLVRDNQQVKKGDVIARIESSDQRVKVEQARAALLQAESQLRGAQANVPLTAETTASQLANAQAALASNQADFERAKAGLEQARQAEISFARANAETKRAAQERAQADLRRMKELVDKEEISRLQYDSYVAAARMAESDLKAALDRVESAQKGADIAHSQLAATQARIEQAKAQVQQAKAGERQVAVRIADSGASQANVAAARANLAAMELQLSYAEIVAPADGVVTKKNIEVGMFVSPGQTMLTLIPMNEIWVTANYKESQLRDIKPGQRAEIELDVNGKKYEGKVDSIAGATGARTSLLPPENATGNFVKVVQRVPVKILIDGAQAGTFPVGTNVVATVFTR